MIVRAAVVQAAAVAFDSEASIARAADLTAEAAAAGAQLVVFPEAFVSGYPRGLDFASVVGARLPGGYEQFAAYAAGAIAVPGPATRALGQVAKGNAVHLVIGVIERDRGTLYCTILFYAPDGALLGTHRKLMPTQMERVLWGQGDGSTMPVLETPLGRLGAVVCWENYMPLMRTAMYAKGIELYCAPTADARDQFVASMRHIAVEGRCFVLSANQFSTRADFPDHPPNALGDDPDVVVSRGGSCIVDPFGCFVSGPCFDAAETLHAELDMSLIAKGKWDFDVVGHYARPDIFRLEVDERPGRTVTTRTEGSR